MDSVILNTENNSLTITTDESTLSITVDNTDVLELVTEGPRGLKGDKGDKGDQGIAANLLLLTLEMEETIPAAGMPISINRATGKGIIANAETYVQSFIVGLAKAPCVSGFVVELEAYALTLPDWTPITGTTHLKPGQIYFLGRYGGLSETADLSAKCVSVVGEAVNASTLHFIHENPILL